MIKEYRKLRGYTQEELAEILNISTRQIQRIESNICIPSVKLLGKIITKLKIADKDVIKYINMIEKEKESKDSK